MGFQKSYNGEQLVKYYASVRNACGDKVIGYIFKTSTDNFYGFSVAQLKRDGNLYNHLVSNGYNFTEVKEKGCNGCHFEFDITGYEVLALMQVPDARKIVVNILELSRDTLKNKGIRLSISDDLKPESQILDSLRPEVKEAIEVMKDFYDAYFQGYLMCREQYLKIKPTTKQIDELISITIPKQVNGNVVKNGVVMKVEDFEKEEYIYKMSDVYSSLIRNSRIEVFGVSEEESSFDYEDDDEDEIAGRDGFFLNTFDLVESFVSKCMIDNQINSSGLYQKIKPALVANPQCINALKSLNMDKYPEINLEGLSFELVTGRITKIENENIFQYLQIIMTDFLKSLVLDSLKNKDNVLVNPSNFNKLVDMVIEAVSTQIKDINLICMFVNNSLSYFASLTPQQIQSEAFNYYIPAQIKSKLAQGIHLNTDEQNQYSYIGNSLYLNMIGQIPSISHDEVQRRVVNFLKEHDFVDTLKGIVCEMEGYSDMSYSYKEPQYNSQVESNIQNTLSYKNGVQTNYHTGVENSIGQTQPQKVEQMPVSHYEFVTFIADIDNKVPIVEVFKINKENNTKNCGCVLIDKFKESLNSGKIICANIPFNSDGDFDFNSQNTQYGVIYNGATQKGILSNVDCKHLIDKWNKIGSYRGVILTVFKPNVINFIMQRLNTNNPNDSRIDEAYRYILEKIPAGNNSTKDLSKLSNEVYVMFTKALEEYINGARPTKSMEELTFSAEVDVPNINVETVKVEKIPENTQNIPVPSVDKINQSVQQVIQQPTQQPVISSQVDDIEILRKENEELKEKIKKYEEDMVLLKNNLNSLNKIIELSLKIC